MAGDHRERQAVTVLWLLRCLACGKIDPSVDALDETECIAKDRFLLCPCGEDQGFESVAVDAETQKTLDDPPEEV